MTNPTKASWTDPTTNTDTTPIAAGEITGYTVGVRLASGTAGTYPYTATVPASAASDLLSALTPVLPTGVSLIGAVMALSTTNGNSPWSVEGAPFEMLAPPSPPTAFIIA